MRGIDAWVASRHAHRVRAGEVPPLWPRNLTSPFATLEYFLDSKRTQALVLPPFIIDQIRQREEQERLRREAERPRVQLPVDVFWPRKPAEEKDEDDVERGVAILEL